MHVLALKEKIANATFRPTGKTKFQYMFKIQSNMKILAETNGLDHLPWMEVKSDWMLQPIGKTVLSFTRVNIYYMKIQLRQITCSKYKLVVSSKFHQISITILYFQDLICNLIYGYSKHFGRLCFLLPSCNSVKIWKFVVVEISFAIPGWVSQIGCLKGFYYWNLCAINLLVALSNGLQILNHLFANIMS